MNAYMEMKSYQKIDVLSEIEDASRFRLTQIVLMRAIEWLNRARFATINGDLVARRDANSRAIGLIDTLREGLSARQQSDVKDNLDNLYSYMTGQLLAANGNQDTAILEQVAGLLTTVKSAWDELPRIVKQNPQMAADLKEYFDVL